jgi:hypothetical protein
MAAQTNIEVGSTEVPGFELWLVDVPLPDINGGEKGFICWDI